MKKFFSSKYVWLGGILLVAGTIGYFTTWGNKKWLVDKIMEKGSTDSSTVLNSKTPGQLRTQLKGLL